MRIFLCLILLMAAVAHAKNDIVAELGAAQQALSEGNYSRAYALNLRYAKRNPLAQFQLGLFYKHGWGRARDPSKACHWFGLSAKGKIPVAQQYLGDCFVEGIGVPADSMRAIELYKQSAQGGNLIALCSAADLLIKGKGVAKDVQQGLQLCNQAAQANSPPAMLMLGNYYSAGTDFPQDLAAARYWYSQAASYRSKEAQYLFGVMLAEGKGGETDLAAALFWLETAASEGYAPAYLPVAILYANAPVSPETGALSPDHLAKIYLWNSAAKARSKDDVQLAEITRIEKLVLSVMPESWRPDLDRKVVEHLAKHKTP